MFEPCLFARRGFVRGGLSGVSDGNCWFHKHYWAGRLGLRFALGCRCFPPSSVVLCREGAAPHPPKRRGRSNPASARGCITCRPGPPFRIPSAGPRSRLQDDLARQRCQGSVICEFEMAVRCVRTHSLFIQPMCNPRMLGAVGCHVWAAEPLPLRMDAPGIRSNLPGQS